MLSAVAWSPTAEARTVMYPPSHGGCVIGWPCTPRSTLPGDTVVVGAPVVVGAAAAVGGGCVGAGIGAGVVGGAVGTRVVGGAVGGSVAAAVGGTTVVDGIGSGVVVGTVGIAAIVDVATDGTDSPGNAPSSSDADATTTQTITPTRNTNTTPMTAGRLTFHRSPGPDCPPLHWSAIAKVCQRRAAQRAHPTCSPARQP